MVVKVLEQLGVDNENIDGAAFNLFSAGGRDGIMKGVLNECAVSLPSSVSIRVETGELMLHGFRVKITTAYDETYSALPSVTEEICVVGSIHLDSDRSVSFSIGLYPNGYVLTKDNLFKTESGLYETVIATLVASPEGLSDIKLKLPVVFGGYTEDSTASVAPNPDTLVMRDSQGAILAQDSEKDNSVVTLGRFNSLDKRLSPLEKKVANLVAQVGEEYFVTDDSVAYTKIVPSEALPYAELLEVGGMTHKSDNLLDAKNMRSYFGYSLGNISVSKHGESITVNGDPNGDYNSIDFVFEAGETYCATYGGTGTLYYVPAAASLTEIKSGVPFTVSGSINCLAFGANGGTFTDLMIVKGNTPADFVPYIEGGMASAAVTEIETVGYNILDLTPALNECLRDNGDGTYTLTRVSTSGNGRFSENTPFVVNKGQVMFCQMELVGTNIDGRKTLSLQSISDDGKTAVSGISFGLVNGGEYYTAQADGTRYVRFYIPAEQPVGAYITFRNPMIQFVEYYKAPVKPYAPYTRRTYPMPDGVQALEGWGLGVDETYHNRIDWERKQYRQEVGIIDMGDLSYSMVVSGGRNIFRCGSIPNIRGYAAGDLPLPAIAALYRGVRVNDTWVDGDMAYGSAAEGYKSVSFVNNAYSDAESFRAAMRGRMLVYALASPIVTDLPNLSDDNFIEVEGGGTITAINEYELSVPTKIEYQLKEV